MNIGIINYAASYFKYKIPKPIRGVLTYKALKYLKLELQANASSVEIDLGGGNHRYLNLVLIDTKYASINRTIPFILTIYPRPVTIPNTAMAIKALQLKDEYNEV